MTKKCRYCGRENEDASEACAECGMREFGPSGEAPPRTFGHKDSCPICGCADVQPADLSSGTSPGHAETRKVTPETLNATIPRYSGAFGQVEAGETFDMKVRVPTNDVPYHVVWALNDRGRDKTGWGRFRMGCERFFRTHRMPALAKSFKRRLEAHYIPSTEIKE